MGCSCTPLNSYPSSAAAAIWWLPSMLLVLTLSWAAAESPACDPCLGAVLLAPVAESQRRVHAVCTCDRLAEPQKSRIFGPGPHHACHRLHACMDMFAWWLQLRGELEKHLAAGDAGELVREGVRVAIVGPPNAGKASKVNAHAHVWCL